LLLIICQNFGESLLTFLIIWKRAAADPHRYITKKFVKSTKGIECSQYKSIAMIFSPQLLALCPHSYFIEQIG
jgi:hypothetical protein